MRRYQGKCICLLFVIAMLSGCGGNAARDGYTGVDGQQNGVTGTAVSGQAADAQKSKQTDTYKYCTEQYLYREYDCGVIQSRLDGTDEKKIRIRSNWGEEVAFLEVKDGWLYYEDFGWNGYSDVLARIPIQTEKDGTETLDVDRTEVLLKDKEDGFAIVKIDAPYVVYIGEENMNVRYNWESGERKILSGKDVQQKKFGSNAAIHAASDKNAYISQPGEGLFRLNWSTEELVKIGEYEIMLMSMIARNRYFIYLPYKDGFIDVDVWMYDEREDKKECIVSWEETAETVEQEMGLDSEKDMDLMGVTDLYYENDRLYVQMQMNWWEGNDYRWEYVLFSKELNVDAALRYEKELTECLREHSTREKRAWKEDGKKTPLYVNASRCIEMVEGKALFWLRNESGKGSLGCFELATGEFKMVGENDREYYMRYYNQTGYGVVDLEDENEDAMEWEQQLES